MFGVSFPAFHPLIPTSLAHTYLFGHLNQRSAILTWPESSGTRGFALLPGDGDVHLCALSLQTAALKRFSSRRSLERYRAGWSLSRTAVPLNTSSILPALPWLLASSFSLFLVTGFCKSSAAVLHLQTVSSVLVN